MPTCNLTDKALVLRPGDDVAVCRVALAPATVLEYEGRKIETREMILAGHKIALNAVKSGDPLHKYGQVIGFATADIAPGDRVHTHNVGMGDLKFDYEYSTDVRPVAFVPPDQMRTFMGYRRPDGRVGTRNFVALVSTVNCSASVSRFVADKFRDISKDYPNVDGVIAITHKGGCALRIGSEDYHQLQRTLAGYAMHPNVFSYVVTSLGCEGNQPSALIDNQNLLQIETSRRPEVIGIQDAGGIQKAVERGIRAVLDLLPRANEARRTPQPISEIVLATNCGGSDAQSGITANPALGWAMDELVRYGGTGLIAETPETYGAEQLLTKRARTPEVGKKLVERIRWWEWYTRILGAEINNNPAPGNIEGGLSTIYEKSLGAVAKGGTTPLNDVLLYAEKIRSRGFLFMDTPGLDNVSVTGLVAGGANVIVFTTGRGSVFGCKPTPSIKVATTTALYRHMNDDMDIDAGTIMSGTPIPEVGRQIFEEIIDVANGKRSKSEIHGVGEEEFAPWGLGPVL
ncbi:MAG: altronate dehydratase [Candidatus Latescibacteria bacterium]|nr:altronate dehydratase [Candidatus Latescibacterota bacterium]